MKIPFTIIALSTLTWMPNVIPQSSLHNTRIDRSNQTRRITRQTNADQMVQNILDWLQGVHTVGNRKIRQDGLRTYLPPTQRPRPFEPAPPEHTFIPGMAPPDESSPGMPGQPEMIPQYPAEEQGPNGIEGPPGLPPVHVEEPTASLEPEEENKVIGEEPVEVSEPPQHVPEYPIPDEHVPVDESPQEPHPTGYPPAGETPQPPFPPVEPPSPTPYGEPDEPNVVGYPPAGESPQPPFPPITSESTEYVPEDETSLSPVPPVQPSPLPTSTEPEENGYRPATEGEGSGYPPADGAPQPPFSIVTTEHFPPPSQPPELEETSPSFPEGPSASQPTESEEPIFPPAEETPQEPQDTSEAPAPAITPQESVPVEPSAFPPLERESTVKPEETGELDMESPSPIQPSSPTEESFPSESPQAPSLPEVNSVTPKVETTDSTDAPSPPQLPDINFSEPEPTKIEPKEEEVTPGSTSTPSQGDQEHFPHVHAIDVECAKDMMTINIEFNRDFDGIIYSKGFYVNSECRYVNENSGQKKYTFTVKLDSCGTQFVNGFDTANQSYLENVLVLQNEPGIQEVWDTVRSVRCLWEGSLKKSLTVSLSVGMLSEEIVTFSGDTAVARLDIQRGEGPFAPSANGLVPIGEKMTLVISVSGDPGFDIQVKDCKAVDTSGDLQYRLTDEDGCVLRPKLFGAFQKTRDTGNTDASIIAYAFFNAFKFPDLMDLMIECNVELCKTDCDVCPNPDQKIQPGKRKRRAIYNETLGEPVKVGKLLRVLLPQDLSEGEAIIELKERKELCISVTSFVYSSVILISLLACSFLFSGYMLLKHRTTSNKHQF